jgi:hypothetical protein
MKISLEELKRAVSWIEVNSRDVQVQIYTGEGNKLCLKCMDRYDTEVEITLFEGQSMLPKIKKTEVLK